MRRSSLCLWYQVRNRSTSVLPAFEPKIDEIQKEHTKIVTSDITNRLTSNYQHDGASRDLLQLSKYYFDGQGKSLRPRLIKAMADAVNYHLDIKLTEEKEDILVKKQHDVALIAEMYHTASLYHDDVLDKAELRRAKTSANHLWGQRPSIFGGNYVLCVSNKILSQLRDPEALVLMSTIISDLVIGELQQMKSCNKAPFDNYLKKTYNKTASLIANSCQAVAQIAVQNCNYGIPSQEQQNNLLQSAFLYGKNLGMAFQLIDDCLDFSASADLLGKPAAADLKLGLATAPVLFASEEFPEINELVKRRFNHKGDVDKAFQIVLKSNGLEQTQFLAKSYGNAAIKSINWMKDSKAKQDLILMVHKSIYRMK